MSNANDAIHGILFSAKKLGGTGHTPMNLDFLGLDYLQKSIGNHPFYVPFFPDYVCPNSVSFITNSGRDRSIQGHINVLR